jgi:predicted DNA-binding transcriptional regulator AlpA
MPYVSIALRTCEMSNRLETRDATILRVRREFGLYSDSILLTELEASAAAGVAFNTLKFWRLRQPEKAPKPTYLQGFMVRYAAGEIRRWRAAQAAETAA